MQKECQLSLALFLHYYSLFLPDENIQAIEIDLHYARSISA